ncbi:MAG: hypothetical protein IJ558_02555 [Treponema sp.]|nr:hypothetical protein [Treponema sp.]
MKNFVLLFLFISSLFFTSCGPVDPFGKRIILENIDSSIEPEKEVYGLSDSISLTHSFTLDSEKFHKYEFYISVCFSDDWKSEDLYDNILVYDELGENVTNKILSCAITENTKIIKKFDLIPQKKGNYIVFVGGRAFTRKAEKGVDSYEWGCVHLLNIQ